MGGMEGASTPEELQLKELLQQMSYGILQSKAPNLMPYVTSFKPIEFDIEKNKAVGAFSLDLNGVDIMIPIVMSEGKVKSPEVFYSQDIDSYLPLSDAWVQEAQRRSLGDIGSSTTAPPGLSSDVDIRALTLPPTTGRFVYANYNEKPNLLKAISNSSNQVKLAFSKYLSKNQSVLKSIVKYNGSAVISALKPTTYYNSQKLAQTKSSDWFVLTPSSARKEFVEAFGTNYKLAFSKACREGVITRDFRKTASIAVERELPLSESMMAQSGITEPNFPGAYNLVTTSGKQEKCLVIPRPFYVSSTDSSFTIDAGRVTRPTNPEDVGNKTPKYLAITMDKKVGILDKIVAVTTTESIANSDLIRDALSYREPRNGDKLFLAIKGGEITNAVYLPEGITNLNSIGDEDYTANYGKTKVIITSSRAVKVPKYIKNDNSGYSNNSAQDSIVIPGWYSPVSISGSTINESDFITSATDLNNFIMGRVTKLSSHTIRIKKSSDSTWAINGIFCESKKDLLVKAASIGINIDVLQDTLASIPSNSSKSYNIIPASSMHKLSSIFGPDPMPPQGMPQDQMGGMPPQGMPQDQMGGMPPQGMPQDQMGGMPPQGMPQDQMGGMPPQGMPPQADQAMQSAAALNDEGLINSSSIAALAGMGGLSDAIAEELPAVENSLDSVAKMLLTVQIREADLVSQLGAKEYSDLESNLKKVLSGLGSVLLSVNKQKNMTSLPEGIDAQI